MLLKKYTLLLAMLLSSGLLTAQVARKVYFHLSDASTMPYGKKKPLLPTVAELPQNMQLKTFLNEKHQLLLAHGHLTASFDSVALHGDTAAAIYTFIGPTYKWAQISLDSLPTEVLNKTGIRKLDWHQQTIKPQQTKELYKKIIAYYENNGYPFAAIRNTGLATLPEGIRTTIVVDKGSLVKIDTLLIHGDVEIASTYLQSYLGIKQGQAYNEQQIKQISARLKELAFLEEAQPWSFRQTIAKNELNLYLKKKKSNQINGLVGLQPNNNETGNMLLTIDALLDLKNAFGYGEHLLASFQNLQRGSPKLILGALVPYTLGLPVAVEGHFDLYRRDTFFTRIQFNGGFRYLLNAKDYIKLSYLDASYRVNYLDLAFVQREKRLPNIIDTRSSGIGTQLFLDKTDYSIAPKRGWAINFNSQLLRRSVKENVLVSTLEDGSGFDYASLYDTLLGASNQYKLFGEAAYYLPIMSSIVGKIGYQGGWMDGKNLFLNELYQIGGFQILRGFDEESMFVSQYHILSAELRLMINSYSYFYAFSDGGITQAKYNGIVRNNVPLSIGGGLQLQNSGGIFRIAIGVGKNEGEGLRLRQAKLHFGYTALF